MIFNNLFKHRCLVLAALALLVSGACATGPDHRETATQEASTVVTDQEARKALAEQGIPQPGEAVDDSVPVVEPRKPEPRKAYIEPTIRVKLFGDVENITMKSDGALTLGLIDKPVTFAAGSTIRFRPRSARVSVRSYAVGIATYKADEYDDAVQRAEAWKKEGYTVRIIRAGGPLIQADGTTTDMTVYWVALGMFKEKRAAEEFRDKLFDQGISCWVIDESVLGAQGNIEVLDSAGRARAYADSRVGITSDKSIHVLDVPFGQGFWGSGHREDRSYNGRLEIIVDKTGMLAIINEVKLEEYVKGIVPVEIRICAPDEALKAQAVAARTEALAKLGIQHVYDPFDFCASQHCQEFGGLTRRTPRTDAAVDATHGRVLVCDGALVDAVYSANCGGHTEDNDLVWSSRPNKALRGVSELHSNPDSFVSPIPEHQLSAWLKANPHAYCGDPRVDDRNNFRWQVRRSTSELTKIVNKYYRIGTIRQIKVLRRGVSGRALSVRIAGDRDVAVINKELQIRRVLGGLKSAMFIVEPRYDLSGNASSFVFYGGGWGHGVGMCQGGAEGMALRGFTFDAILKHYFKGAELKKLYD